MFSRVQGSTQSRLLFDNYLDAMPEGSFVPSGFGKRQIAGGEIIGTLDMGRREPFTEEDAKRLESIANQLTAAIKRKQAEEAMRQRAEELAVLMICPVYFTRSSRERRTFWRQTGGGCTCVIHPGRRSAVW